MKPSLQLKIGQSLTMTPQLQQAIRLLQLSSVELQAEIQHELESNIMLELEDGEGEHANGDSPQGQVQQIDSEDMDDSSATVETGMEMDTMPDDLPVDSAWDDVYEVAASHRKTGIDSYRYENFESQDTSEKTLRGYLGWQLNLTPASDVDKIIAMTIIDSLDDDGYLTSSLEDILALVKDAENDADHIGLEEVEAVLRLIQNMEPAGVGSRNIKECLNIQLKNCSPNTPYLAGARCLVDNYLDLLAAHDYNQLMRNMKVSQEGLTGIVNLIQSMNPRPGGSASEARVEYVMPDVYVKKDKGVWKVELNTEAIPNLRVNAIYADMVKRANNSADNAALKSHLHEARWFIKSLRSRSETLLRVTTCIVERQSAFLEYGEEAMKPLILHDIAEAMDMHESTISRVTTRKYMLTPRGIFELKYFFSSHVNTRYGGTSSSTAIRALIKKMINGEMPNKPLSDSKIAAMLESQGIHVARRTVAKYREAMTIPPSNERKRLT